MIPPKKNRVRPIFYDKEIGKDQRKVENYFCRLKRFRRTDTRYEKRGDTFITHFLEGLKQIDRPVQAIF